MKKMILPLLLSTGLIASAGMTYAADLNKDHPHVIFKTSDGNTVRGKVHADDAKHLNGAKKGDKIELFAAPCGGMMGNCPGDAFQPGVLY